MLKKLAFIFLFVPLLSFAAPFVEGKDYVLVSNAPAVASNTNKLVITEFFSYGCPWCYRIESPLNQWMQSMGNKVELNKVPVVFKPDWELYAKAYYTAKILALSNKMNPLLFKKIQDERKPLANQNAMIHFFTNQGIDREIARSAFEHSPTIEMKVKTGMRLMADYEITAVPAFVVNNKYKTDLQMAQSPERLFQIIDYLARR